MATAYEPPVLCGSLSLYPVSLGAAMHTAGYRELGLHYEYIPFRVQDDLAGALRGMRALGIRGLGISMPFKIDVLRLVDEIDPLAQRIGAANTVVNDDGVLHAYNTDGAGALRAMEEAGSIADKRCLVLGAGGAARAIAHTLKEAGATVIIANRTRARGEELAGELDAQVLDLRELTSGDIAGVDVIINATSVGMDTGGSSESPIQPERLHPELTVMDIVYKPVRTALLKAAKDRGAKTIHGGRMLLYQAARQFELYTGQPAPTDAMNRALSSAIDEPPETARSEKG
jgi:shikimate dehydrogenase